MSLVAGRGPLSSDPAGRFAPPMPADVVYIEPHPRRVQAFRDGRTGDRHRKGADGAPARPSAQLRRSRSARSATYRPSLEPEAPGFVHVSVGCRRHLAGGRPQTRPLPAEPISPGRLPTDEAPPTRHRQRTVLVDTHDTVIVFETALEPRLYVAPSACSHRSAAADRNVDLLQLQGRGDVLVRRPRRHRHQDVAWSYQDPPPESLANQRVFQFRCRPGSRSSPSCRLPVVRTPEPEHMLGDHVAEHLEGAAVDPER